MNYAVFFKTDLVGKLAPLMGSDSYIPIDGRLGLERQRQVAVRHARSLAAVQPDIIAFQLRRGSIRQSSASTTISPIGPDHTTAVKAAMSVGVVGW